MVSPVTFKNLFKSEIKFVAGASTISAIPNFNRPQIAFVGKSNVGKSSLINVICNNKSLAKVSHTPGRTQQINFFDVGGTFSLVDLPGYGFAKVSHKTRNNWEKLITYYLFDKRPQLINLLIDSRRGLKENDMDVIALIMEHNLNMQIIFTKCDQISAPEIEELQNSTISLMETKYYRKINVIFASARTKKSIAEIQQSFYEYIATK